jgi:3'-5' exoribonuclease 1
VNYIILDLEATCWQEKGLKNKSEIIEIGAIKINQSQQLISQFSSFVKPSLHPVLSPFCTQLTSIQQKDMELAETFPTVLRQFKEWINVEEAYVLCSWGFYDKQQFKQDCLLHHLETNWLEQHISLKHQHATIKGLKKPMGMAGALYIEGLTLEGTHHRGIDDAKNIAKIFLKYFGKWKMESE